MGNWRVIAKGYGVSSCSNKNVLKLIIVMGAQLREILKTIELYTISW